MIWMLWHIHISYISVIIKPNRQPAPRLGLMRVNVAIHKYKYKSTVHYTTLSTYTSCKTCQCRIQSPSLVWLPIPIYSIIQNELEPSPLCITLPLVFCIPATAASGHVQAPAGLQQGFGCSLQGSTSHKGWRIRDETQVVPVGHWWWYFSEAVRTLSHIPGACSTLQKVRAVV